MNFPASPAHAEPAALRYDRTAIALHWIMAVLIVVVGTLGARPGVRNNSRERAGSTPTSARRQKGTRRHRREHGTWALSRHPSTRDERSTGQYSEKKTPTQSDLGGRNRRL